MGHRTRYPKTEERQENRYEHTSSRGEPSAVRSLYSSALILLPFFTSGLALAQPGGSRRAGIEENTRSSPRAEPGARTEESNTKSLWGSFQDRAGEEISGQAWISIPPRSG